MSGTALRADNAGVGIAYDVRGAGEPVLLIQGLAYARWGWEPVLDPLAESFLVVAFDNRGAGASDVPPGPYSALEMARDALAVLDAAELERAHVVGASLGGMVAQELALLAPERVGRLVLACTIPGGSASYPMPDVTVSLLARAPTLPPEQALRLFVENALSDETVASRPEIAERILAHRLAQPQSLAAWQAQAAAGVSFDAYERLGSIASPTLVVTGTEDVVVDPRNAELLARLIPNARLERFEGAGHVLFWEQPGRFVELVTELLQGRG